MKDSSWTTAGQAKGISSSPNPLVKILRKGRHWVWGPNRHRAIKESLKLKVPAAINSLHINVIVFDRGELCRVVSYSIPRGFHQNCWIKNGIVYILIRRRVPWCLNRVYTVCSELSVPIHRVTMVHYTSRKRDRTRAAYAMKLLFLYNI